ncbi:MAG: stage III sporulation protein AA [Clostridia bacterium]|nr:stage III sporulation protein AA [Clostridia bacterium]
MEKSTDHAMNTVLNMLPAGLRAAVGSAVSLNTAEELRFRVSRPVQIVTPTGEEILRDAVFTAENARELMEKLCRHSVYAREDELRRGFLTVEGGARVGVAGRPVTDGNGIIRLTDVSCFNIRITREAVGCAEGVMAYLTERGRPVSALIAAPPAGGKTTLLRDVARCFSNGVSADPVKVCLADERGELAGCVGGAPSFDVGDRTDVMELAPKAEAIRIFIRTMSPDVIVTDEIGGEDDASALEDASRSGVAVIASAHASSPDELMGRKALEAVMKTGVFRRVLMLKRNGSVLRISPIKL